MFRSPLFRHIAALVVAVAIPLAGAASAQAYDSPHYGEAGVHHVAFKPYQPYRSSWS